MYIESMTFSGFRCFAAEPVAVSLNPQLTAVVGPNGAGKTALLQGLIRMYGATNAERTVTPQDFHLPKGSAAEDKTKQLSIDVVLRLPELADGSATAASVAPVFRRLQIATPGSIPACRMRLEARWDDDGTAEGSVTQELFWISTLDTAIKDEQKIPVVAPDRGLIRVYYTPANRDAQAQIRATTGALAARLLKAIEWSKGTEKAIDKASEALAKAFEGEGAIQAIAASLKARWEELHDGDIDKAPGLSLISRRFEDVVSRIGVVFRHGPAGEDRGIDALSDGQRSLFYFALAASVFELERDAANGKVKGFLREELSAPVLTLFAIEEPENHLSPYYLSRILQQLRKLVTDSPAQAIVSSHSPSVVSRVPPESVRYCRLARGASKVQVIPMPADGTEAVKFVRSAMLAFPELYFARMVILVEGDSERIVLPKLAEGLNLPLDPSFVAIAPLGGRHVTHFWRLLSGLGIPYVTLLDLDLGRNGGGFGRLKTAFANLIELGSDPGELLMTESGKPLTNAEFEGMHTWVDLSHLDGWVTHLETKSNVFFSSPLDLDLAMLAAFPAAYEKVIDGTGPRMTNEAAAEVVLGTGGMGDKAYTKARAPFLSHMANYRYHFLTHSKPATHLRALTYIENADLALKMPDALKRLLKHVDSTLSRLI
ncbi:ATP-dependent nuclease [Chitinolyticbacter albus]|uniref:ATP-dependent nuclease n=1 Tax=Chitinolyticbacter albus TaxID=2961951 RepID=UPI00210CCBBF|nr:AAA family ATPase [Chitinolyticbacter albus]